MKLTRLSAFGALALSGAMVLVACSSGADQAQESTSPSVAQSETRREAAKADNSKNVTVPATKAGKFSDVTLTHEPGTKCTRTEKKRTDNQEDVLLIECSNVKFNMLGDSVYVRVPGKNYEIDVSNESPHLKMFTTQRDYVAMKVAWEADVNEVHWTAPDISTVNKGWAVGVDANQYEPIVVRMWVSKTS